MLRKRSQIVAEKPPAQSRATKAELRDSLRALVEAVDGTPVSGLAAPARKLLGRG